MDNKLEFARRLRDAMEAAGLEPRPGVLLTLFNTHYWGRSVTFQAVSRWLTTVYAKTTVRLPKTGY